MNTRGFKDFDYSPDNIDEYAVFIMVWQGTKMNLNRAEKILATYALLDRGWDPVSIAQWLGASDRQVYRWIKDRHLVAQVSRHPIPCGEFAGDRVGHANMCHGMSELVSMM